MLKFTELETMNEPKSIIFDNVLLTKVMNFGALKYGPGKICQLLGYNDEQSDEFMKYFSDNQSELRIKYEQGVSIGDYNLDAELAKLGEKGDILAISTLGTRQYHRRMDELKKDLFDV